MWRNVQPKFSVGCGSGPYRKGVIKAPRLGKPHESGNNPPPPLPGLPKGQKQGYSFFMPTFGRRFITMTTNNCICFMFCTGIRVCCLWYCIMTTKSGFLSNFCSCCKNAGKIAALHQSHCCERSQCMHLKWSQNDANALNQAPQSELHRLHQQGCAQMRVRKLSSGALQQKMQYLTPLRGQWSAAGPPSVEGNQTLAGWLLPAVGLESRVWRLPFKAVPAKHTQPVP